MRSLLVTHDGGLRVLREKLGQLNVIKPSVVGPNVFVGDGSVVLPGVTIGDNVVIGASSVVSRDIAAGAPVRVLKPFFDYESKIQGAGDLTLNPVQKRNHCMARFKKRDLS